MKFENKGKWIKEARSIDPKSVISKEGKYYHKVNGYEVELRDGKFHRANTKDNAQTRVINKKISDLANTKDMSKGTHDTTNIKERKVLAELRVKYNELIDRLEQASTEDEKDKIKYVISILDNAIQRQKELIKISHDIETDKLRTKQIPKMIQSKKEAIDDNSTGIFGDEPLDDIEDSKTEGYHKIKRPGDTQVGIAKDGSPLYGRNKSIKEPKQYNVDKVQLDKSGNPKLGTHDVDFEYDADDNLVAVDKTEKELTISYAQNKVNAANYERTLNKLHALLTEKEKELDRPYTNSVKVKNDIDELKKSIKELSNKKKQALLASSQDYEQLKNYR